MTHDNPKSFLELRQWMHEDRTSRSADAFGINLSDWSSPYTRVKVAFNTELAVPVVLLALRSRLSPNSISISYSLVLIVAFLFMLTPIPALWLLSGLAFFTVSSLDWADGTVARLSSRFSEIGAQLDSSGGQVKLIIFPASVCLLVWHMSDEEFGLVLALLICILTSLISLLPSLPTVAPVVKSEDSIRRGNMRRIGRLLRYDGRARYTDTVLLLCVLSLLFRNWYALLALVIFWLALLIATLLAKYYRLEKV